MQVRRLPLDHRYQWNGKKWSYLDYILKVDPTEFPNRLDIGWEGEGEVKVDLLNFGHERLESKVAMYSTESGIQKQRHCMWF